MKRRWDPDPQPELPMEPGPALKNPDRAPRKPRARTVARAVAVLAQTPVADLIDAVTGAANGERIIEALSVLALGTEAEAAEFFGRKMRLRPQDRQAALVVLEARRFGRVPEHDRGGGAETRPVQIVNVFTSSEDYAFVTQARPKNVTPPRRLERADE